MTTTIPADPGTSTDLGSVTASRWRDPWWIASIGVSVVLVALVMWPIIDAGRAALDLIWRPTGDWAVLTLRVEDVGRATPMVGPYSRFGWSHPGPLMYWLLAIPYHLFGDRPEAILAAAAFLNAITIAAFGAVAWRRGRLPFVAVTMAAIAVLLHAMGPQMIRDPWNPYITLLPLALFVLLAWSIAEGDWWMWPFAAFVFSFELESHVGYLPMLGLVSATALFITWRARRDRPMLPASRNHRLTIIISTVAVLVFCWYPVLVDQFVGTGNLGDIIRYFASPGSSTAGLGDAIHQMARQLAIPGAPWLGQKELAGANGSLVGASVVALVVPVLAMAGAILLAIRSRCASALRLDIIVVASAIAGFIATAQVVGPIYDWIIRWWWVIAALWWMSIVWSVWSALVTHLRNSDQRRIATVLLTGMALLVTIRAVRPIVDASKRTPAPNASASEVLGNFLPQTIDALRGSGPVLVESTGSVRGDYGDAIRLELERNGVEIVATKDIAYRLGTERSLTSRTPVATLWIVNADAIADFRQDPSMDFIAMWDPLNAEERAAFRIDEAALQQQFIAAGRPDLAIAITNGTGNVDRDGADVAGVDQELLRSIESRRRKGDPVAIFIGPSPAQIWGQN